MDTIKETNHCLFSGQHMDIKKAIYKSKQQIEATVRARDYSITGMELVAEKELPFKIKEHNSLIDKLNTLKK